MNTIFYSKDFLVLLIYFLIFIPIFASFIVLLAKKKLTKKTYIIALVVFVLIIINIPIEKIVDMIPFQFKNVEDRFNFDYSYHYQFAYAKKYKNTYFVMGIPKKSSNFSYQFASYVKTKNGWKSLEQPSSINKKERFINSYKIHYFNNKINNITGIFIESIESMDDKDGLNEKTNITDKYDTQFSYIKSKDELPIKQDINIEDFPVPFKKKRIIKEHKGSYIYFGIVEQNIKNDYYLEIDGKKIRVMG